MVDFKLAVLITCFNRREVTLSCLSRLFEITNQVHVFVVDDNSSDGTFEAIKNQFPDVHIFKGDGNLFWNRGMHHAWKEASKFDFDYYLWLNDDVVLYSNFLNEIWDCYHLAGEMSIISGLIENAEKSKIIYGGYDKSKKIIQPNGKIQDITFMNGNVVLVSKEVFHKLGNLDPVFHHDLGDVDYGLRAQKNSIRVVSTRIPIGKGKENPINRIRLSGTSIFYRFKKLYSPLGSNPNLTFYFNTRHFGFFHASIFFFFVIFLNSLPDFLVKLLFGNKYMGKA